MLAASGCPQEVHARRTYACHRKGVRAAPVGWIGGLILDLGLSVGRVENVKVSAKLAASERPWQRTPAAD